MGYLLAGIAIFEKLYRMSQALVALKTDTMLTMIKTITMITMITMIKTTTRITMMTMITMLMIRDHRLDIRD